jgi:N4-gp56 family major capsid protein
METQIPTNAQVTQWDNDYFVDFVNQNWFTRFEDAGSNAMIHVLEDLTTKPGGTITVHLANRLTGDAKDHTETLEGQEEDADLRSFPISIREYSHAVRWPSFQQQLTGIDMRNLHKDLLLTWNMELDRDRYIAELGSINGVDYGSATEVQKDAWLVDNADRVLFGAATTNNSSNDHSASLANVDSTNDKLTPEAVDLMKYLAKHASPKVRPIKSKSSIDDSDAYVLFCSSIPYRDFKQNSTVQQANREARQRGVTNPIFKGANLIWDNVAIYEMEDIAALSGVGNSSIDVAPVYLCGAQALSRAWAMRPTTATDNFDYGRKNGIAIKQWCEFEKLRFGTGTTDRTDYKDHGVVTGFFSAAA